jgi:signal transduction histidine kinase
LAKKYGWSNALIIPIQKDYQSEAIGAFGIYGFRSGSGRFIDSDWDKKVLSFLAKFALLAVKNDERLKEIRTIQDQKAMAEAFAVFGDIAANLLHNLNNKLGTIPVRVQGIMNKSKSSVETDIYLANNLDEIERAASDAMTSVRENLDYLRPILANEIEIEKCISEAIIMSKFPKEIIFNLENIADLPLVIANEKSLVFVFSNLIENAANAMGGKGIISFFGKELEEFVEINVKDNGPGIPHEIQEKIFEFDYSDSSPSTPGKLGFGLWWVKTLMNRLGGFITVESSKDIGSNFKIKLPKVKGSL